MATSFDDMDKALGNQILERLNKLDTIEQSVNKLSVIEDDVKDLKLAFLEYKQNAADVQEQLADACEAIEDLKSKVGKMDKLESEIEFLKERNIHLEKKLNIQENYSRRENIIIHGVTTTKDENCFKAVSDIFIQMGVGPRPLQRCHRLRYGTKPLIARFVNFQDKLEVMKNRKLLKGTNIYINDDISPDVAEKQAELMPILRYVKHIDKKARVNLVQDTIKYKNQTYDKTSLSDMPLALSKVGTNVTDTHVMFAGEYSTCSNLHPCNLTIDGKRYNSSEQFFQNQKCLDLNNQEVADKVMLARSPREAMNIGKSIKTTDKWCETTGVAIMEKALTAKYEQVPTFTKCLQEHKGKQFVEGTRNPIWGIGHPFSYQEVPAAKDWLGKNLLGNILTKLSANSQPK